MSNSRCKIYEPISIKKRVERKVELELTCYELQFEIKTVNINRNDAFDSIYKNSKKKKIQN